MYKIKQIPEDFIVKEINTLHFTDDGSYAYYLLRKTNYNTIDAVKKVSDAFHIDEKYINFAGTKDRAAITEQYISINRGPKKSLELKDINLEYLGNGKERLNLGCLEKNYFEITVRNIDKLPQFKYNFVNYFDDQRFGRNNDNHLIGKLILKGKYDEACKLIPETADYISKSPKDFVGALRSIPKKTLKFYIHAYQSHLLNIAAKELSKTRKESIKVPIFGFGTEFEDNEVEQTYQKILNDENINFRDFVNKKIPELSEEGATRELYVKPESLEISDLEDDKLNLNKKKYVIKFSLPPGAYATNIIKNLMEEDKDIISQAS